VPGEVLTCEPPRDDVGRIAWLGLAPRNLAAGIIDAGLALRLHIEPTRACDIRLRYGPALVGQALAIGEPHPIVQQLRQSVCVSADLISKSPVFSSRFGRQDSARVIGAIVGANHTTQPPPRGAPTRNAAGESAARSRSASSWEVMRGADAATTGRHGLATPTSAL
jgi:hypothetical protein